MARKVLLGVNRGRVDREKKVEEQRDTRNDNGKTRLFVERAWGKHLMMQGTPRTLT